MGMKYVICWLFILPCWASKNLAVGEAPRFQMHTNNGTKVNTHVIWTYNKTKISYIATYIKKQLEGGG